MSQTLSLTEKALTYGLIIGFSLIGVSLAVLAIGTAWDHSWFIQGLVTIFPALILGVFVVSICAKALE